MKKYLFYLTIISALLITNFVACNKNDAPIIRDEDIPSTNNPMTITVHLKSHENDINIVLAGTGKITINWGNGTSNTQILTDITDTSYNKYDYPLGKYTITITGDNITYLRYYDWNLSGQIVNMDVSKNPTLTELVCDNSALTSLDLSKNTALVKLSCVANQLTTLDLSNNTALTELVCFFNQLTSLDVSKNPALTHLNCYRNNLTSLDVSGCTALTHLNCRNNWLTSLDVSECSALTYLVCIDNELTDSALNDLFNTLPHANEYSVIGIYGNPGMNTCDWSIAEAKGWSVNFSSFL